MAENPAPQTRPAPRISRGTVIFLVIVVILSAAAAAAAYITVRNLVESWDMTQLPGVKISNSSSPGTIAGTAVPTSVLQVPSGPAALPWDGTSRVTILVMGLD